MSYELGESFLSLDFLTVGTGGLEIIPFPEITGYSKSMVHFFSGTSLSVEDFKS